MSEKLQRGWTKVSVGQACRLVNGRAFKPTDWTEEGLPIIRIQNLNNPEASFNRYSKPVEPKFLVADGELLFAWSGTPGTSFGAHIWERGPAILNQHIFRVLDYEALFEKRFLRYAINDRLGELIDLAHGGAGLAHVTKPKFEATELALPPLNEQRRIVAKLEALQARSRRAREALDAVPPLLEKLRQSILAAAFRGDLTKDWRAKHKDVEPASELLKRTEQPGGKSSGRAASTSVRAGLAAISVGHPGTKAPVGWEWVALARIARMESGHTPSREHANYWNGGIPWIGIKDAREFHGKVIPETTQTVSELGLANSAARLLPARTVCLSRTASVGYVTIMGTAMATSQDFANWICTPALLPEYLMLALIAEGDHIRTFGEGSTHTTIYFPELKALHVCLAPLEEQKAIVRRVTQLLNGVERLRTRLEKQTLGLGTLERSVLAKAFRGEFVPQDPNDEPAEVMLARLRGTSGAAIKGATKPKRGTRTPT